MRASQTGVNLQQTRPGEYAAVPVQIPQNDRRGTTVWSLNQTIYWILLNCHDLIADTNLSVSINQTDCWLSWDVRGMEFSWLSEECTLDFAYDNVLYDNSDFPLKTGHQPQKHNPTTPLDPQ
ncbi:hypothetical protein BDV12DRAFT_195897 [Aspergillus spectabilis]